MGPAPWTVPERLRPVATLRGAPTAAPYVRETCRRTPEAAGGGEGTSGGLAKWGDKGALLACACASITG